MNPDRAALRVRLFRRARTWPFGKEGVMSSLPESGRVSFQRRLLNRAKQFLGRFALAKNANVAMIYGLALMPTIGAAGAAVDYGRAVIVRMRLSAALDAAGLAVGSTPGLTEEELKAKAQKFFDANFPPSALGEPANLSVSITGDIVKISATAKLDTAFMGVFGVEYLDVASKAEITRETKGLEVVLALDNTGSMAQSGKLPALKTATTELINILFGDSATPALLKMGLVPFSETVRLDTVTAINSGWMDLNGQALWAQAHFDNSKHPFSVWSTMTNSSWGGCVEARPNGLEELDTSPDPTQVSTRWVPFFNPDEPDSDGDYNQDYFSDGTTGTDTVRLRKSSKYVGKTSTKPNVDCSMQKVLAMTNAKATLLSYVNGMQATGYTHIAIGAAWGWRVLSPNAPFTEGAAYGDPEWQKALVLMTDGVNTIPTVSTFYKSDYTAYGYLQEARLGTTTASAAVTQQNTRTSLVCERMKDLEIRIYTILLMEDNVTTYNMMRDCATSPELFFDTPTTGELQEVFQAIANDLSNLRLSK
jgi:Flp pilus assembly protein TadG